MKKFDYRHPTTIDTDDELDINLSENSEDFDETIQNDINPNFDFFSSNNFRINKNSSENQIKKTLKTHDNDYDVNAGIKQLANKYSKSLNAENMTTNDQFEEKAIAKNHKLLNKPVLKTSNIQKDASLCVETKDFSEFGLSKAVTKVSAINDVDFIKTTPIQSGAIPHVLNGRDLFACAKTGSGKTAAYVIPIIERLLRTKSTNYTRILIILPTRELALQVFGVFKDFSKYTSINVALTTGGQLNKVQEAQLRSLPDVIIATPGRLIDHLHNCPSFNLKDVEILVLDEADRLLDENFSEQLEEIVRLSSKTRQTMLFSATLSDKVDELSNLTLKNPVRLYVDSSMSTVGSLTQEFVQIKDKDEAYRFVYVCALVCRNFHEGCLIFCETKRQAHRLRIILGLLGENVTELHGDLTQLQRYEALNSFRDGQVSVLVATNLAARGLDIEGINTVININAPSTIQDYIHRVGRTARAGKVGRSVTIIGEKDKKMLKLISKSTPTKLQLRNIPQEIIDTFKELLSTMETDVDQLLKDEKQTKELLSAEKEISRATNKIVHDKEIKSRPRRNFMKKENKKSKTKSKVSITNSFKEAPYKNIKIAKKSNKLKSLKQQDELVPKKVGKKLRGHLKNKFNKQSK